MRAGTDQQTADDSTADPSIPLDDEERALGRPLPLSVRSRSSGDSTPQNETELLTRPNSAGGFIKRKTSQFLGAISSSSQRGIGDVPLAPILASLVEAYVESDIAAEIKSDAAAAVSSAQINRDEISSQEDNGRRLENSEGDIPIVAVGTSLLGGRKRASWTTQFRILSGRAFKNLYRDPALLAAHYISSIVLACESCLLSHIKLYLTFFAFLQ
jgi:hypothetical protein